VTGLVAPGGTASIPIDISGVFNLNPANYKNARKALANVKAGVSNMQVLCLGDSTTAGNNGSTTVNEVSNSWVHQLATQLTAQGIPTGWQNIMGDKGLGTWVGVAGAAGYDIKLTTVPAGWNVQSGSTGGQMFQNSSTTNPLTYTPTVVTDTLDLYYLDSVASSVITVKGGAAGATASSPTGTTPAASGRVKKVTFTCAGTSVWTLAVDGINWTDILGWHVYNAATKEVSLLNCGQNGVTSSTFNNTTALYQSLSAISNSPSGMISPLALISLGINDAAQGLQAGFYANMYAIITALQAASTDVLLIVPPTPSTVTATADKWQVITNAYYQLASTYKLALVDLGQRNGDYTTANAAGYMGDTVHPNNVGYVDMASSVAQFFKRL
jgi:lysophospholipase L1-like esterase